MLSHKSIDMGTLVGYSWRDKPPFDRAIHEDQRCSLVLKCQGLLRVCFHMVHWFSHVTSLNQSHQCFAQYSVLSWNLLNLELGLSWCWELIWHWWEHVPTRVLWCV